MQPLKMAAALLLCSSLLSSCGEKRVVTALPIPPERMDCVAIDKSLRPKLPAERQIDWAKLQTVAQAKAEHEAAMKVEHDREAIVARYIVQIEGVQFACANDAAWLREREAQLSH